MAQQYKVGKVATTVYKSEDSLEVRYHGTTVVRVEPNGRTALCHGGWMTPTTKTRINQAANEYGLGFNVYQKDHVWYVACDGQDRPWDEWQHGQQYGEIVIRNGN